MSHAAVWEAPARSRGLGSRFRRLAAGGTARAHALDPERPTVTLCNRGADRFEPMRRDFESVAEFQRCKRCEERLAGATV